MAAAMDYVNLIEQTREYVRLLRLSISNIGTMTAREVLTRDADRLDMLADAVETLTAERDEARKDAHNRRVEYETCHDLHDQEREARKAAEAARDRETLAWNEEHKARIVAEAARDRLAGAHEAILTRVEDANQEFVRLDIARIAREALAATEDGK